MSNRITTLIAIAFIALSNVARAEDYEIKLVRPVKVGQKYTFTAEGAMVRKTKITFEGAKDPQPPPREDEDGYGVRLEGTIEVKGVNTDGEESVAACTVDKAVRITREGETDLVPKGRVITATGGKDETTFAVDQGELTDDAKAALELILRMGEEDGYTDDRIYGTTKRQPVGGTWPLDASAAADEAKGDGVIFDPKDITGALTLEAIDEVGGVKCLRIAGVTEIKNFTAKPPEDMTMERGYAKAKYTGHYPLDPAVGSLAETTSVTHRATYRGKNAAGKGDIVVESTVQRAAEMKRTFIK